MKIHHRFSSFSLAAASLIALAGCSSAVPASSSDSERAPAESAAAPSGHPDPVVRIDLENGNTLEVYDFGTEALVMERGASPEPVATRIQGLSLVEMYRTVRPGLPVPASLTELQERTGGTIGSHEHAPSASHTPTSIGGELFASAELRSPTAPRTESPIGCNNICCDPVWLKANICNVTGYDYTWYLFNYGWSYENDGSISRYYGAACSASGTSQFNVSVNGSGGDWSVPQGTYVWYSWVAGCYLFNCPANESQSSSVNSQSNQHLHTYCGGIWD